MAKNDEHLIQSCIVQFLRMNKIMIFSVPNGTYVPNKRTRIMLQESGILSGVSDLVVVGEGKIIFVEIKTLTGKQSETQKKFQRDVEALGHRYLIWRSLEDADLWMRTTYGAMGNHGCK